MTSRDVFSCMKFALKTSAMPRGKECRRPPEVARSKEIDSSLDPRSNANFTDTLTFGLVRPRTGLQHLIVKKVQRLRIVYRQGHDALDGAREGLPHYWRLHGLWQHNSKTHRKISVCMPACVKVYYTHELTAAAVACIRSAQEQDSQHPRIEERDAHEALLMWDVLYICVVFIG